MASDYTIYLNSSACSHIFSDNKTSRFTNKLGVPINLNTNIEYEIGLVSILYPNEYYAILGNVSDYGIHIKSEINIGNEKIKNVIHSYIPNRSILAGDMKKIVLSIDEDLINELKVYYDRNFEKYINNNGILNWNETEQRVELRYKKGNTFRNGELGKINIKFHPRLGRILGFRSDTDYCIYGENEQKNHLAKIPTTPTCGVDFVYVYCDIIHPSPFGGQLVNILDCFTLQNGGNKGIHNTIYKTMNTNLIDQISIILTDQEGREIHFHEYSSLTCVLHIRPK